MLNFAFICVLLSCVAVLPVKLSPQFSSSCNEKRCLRSEMCVMENAPCFFGIGQCGKMAVCRTIKPTSTVTCENVKCPPGQYCSLNEDWCSWKPCAPRIKCVDSNSTAYGWRG